MFSNWIITHINVQEVHQTKNVEKWAIIHHYPKTKISRMKYRAEANLTSHKFQKRRIIYIKMKNNKK